ncbi:DUF1800 domain-containing protein [Edaphobacter dinghuensis]|uniref:DUF1800 domain-containing protein n=1 Tax=Edaphobacter dinghuensis TaxID=1560005 RepID=A0A917HBF0_9BACT|nr:DUF1800 domain-containing protein [Edaphobacter dinghuensis]GGG73468.1 hypothetical protein GCM10011585_14960 [Edaphobacter dinghuensis]
MRAVRVSADGIVGGVVRVAAFALAGLVSCQPMAAGVRTEKKQSDGQEKVLHALNRFTFGPRPGEVAQVEAMGLKRWFEQQLNPSSIDDSALDARLAMFPAMRISQTELMERYPTPQRLRQMMRTGAPLPGDPVERAIYGDEMARIEAQKAKQEAAAAGGNAMQAGGGGAAEGSAKYRGLSTALRSGRDDVRLGQGASAAAKMSSSETGVGGMSAGDMDAAAAAAREEKLYADLDALKVVNLPPDARMRRMVGISPEEFLAFRQSLKPGDLVVARQGLSPEQKETFEALQGGPQMVDAELLQSRMIRDIYSERQLQAVMTDFWLNHFNVYLRKNQNEPYLLPAFERDVIRPHALGKFEDLLVATAKSPAMLVYLDNWLSIGPDSQAAQNAARAAQRAKNPQVKQALKDRGLNENYGRELMELHTIGVQCEVSADRSAKRLDKACGKGYTQQDVIEVAKALTGWTVDKPDEGSVYKFDERRHEPGTKMVLGKKVRENGEVEGLEVLHMLATSPATARLISTQLAVRFVSDTPPPALVDRMAKAFVKSHGDIKVVLRTMFDSPEFWSPEVYRAKVKTPVEFVVSAVRASGAEVTDAQPLVAALNRLGMPLYGMQTPNGYSWKADGWVNTGDLVDRMNFALALSGDHVRGVQTDWRGLLGESQLPEESVAAKEQRLESILLEQPASEHTRDTVLQQFAAQSFPAFPAGRVVKASVQQEDREAEGMAGLLLGSPDFQRR